MPIRTMTRFPARKRLIAAAISACFVSAPAWSNPAGPQVVNGSASFNQAGNLLTVNNSNGAIINWNSFSIAANETTRFNQSSASSSVLNRVIANDPSVLLGTLSSNGQVWLVNPAGIMVGQGARIDVAGFVASTLNVANQDFLAGRLNFGATPNAGSIQNYGQITTPSGGSVYLIAPSVTNNGIINAPNGEVILAAGQTVQLLDTGTPGVSVAITGAEGNATNLGQIISEAGRIGMAGVLVNNSGLLNASSVVNNGGRIFLQASQDAYVDGAGRIVATGTKGGSIEVLGNRVAVMDNASLEASGQNGGGTVLVGGDEHGANPAVQNAQSTFIGSDAVIRADGTTTGTGGRVIVWADGDTSFRGSISVRGGAQSGNGGFIETSGKQTLDVAGGRVDARAPNGATGSWLLDPDNYVISSDQGSTIASNMSETNVTIEATGNGDGSTTNGNVTLQSNLNLTSGTGNTFTALAGENINFGSYSISTSGHNVALQANAAGYGGSGLGAITSNAGYGNITTGGGNVTLIGASVTVGAIDTSSNTIGTAGVAGSSSSSSGTSQPHISGGVPGIAGGVGGSGGQVSIQAINSITTGTITTRGAQGGTGGDSSNYEYITPNPAGAGGAGGIGGDVILTVSSSSGTIHMGSIDTTGGQGGAGGAANGWYYIGSSSDSIYSDIGGQGGAGGKGGDVMISAAQINTTGDGIGSITARGGQGGASGFNLGFGVGWSTSSGGVTGGTGGTGGSVVLTVPTASSSAITTGNIDASGGTGGTGGNTQHLFYYYYDPYTFYYIPGGPGGTGGDGGQVTVNVASGPLSGSLMTVYGGAGLISTSGGSGGPAGSNIETGYNGSPYGSVGNTGPGGNVTIAAIAGDIDFGALPLFPISANSITTGGGSLQFTAGNDINFGSALPDLSSVSTGGGILQFKAGNNINFSSDVTVPSSWQAALANSANYYGGAGNIQFRAGNNIDLAYGGSSHAITATGQNLTLSANDDLGQSNATLYTTSGTGSIIGGGNIITGGGNITLSGYGVAVGALNTSGLSDGSNGSGSVSITTSAGDISTGNITTRALSSYGGDAGSVGLQTDTGTIAVSGTIDARGANGDSTYTWGSTGGNVVLLRTGMTAPASGNAVHVTGNILTYGGDAFAGSGNSGGDGGYVNVASENYYNSEGSPTALLGKITIDGSIDTHGGNGSNATGSWAGSGGWGGDVYLLANGSVTSGAISTYGGNAGNSDIGYGGYSGAGGGYVTVQGSSVTVNGSIDTHGGNGGVGWDGGEGGSGGDGGSGGSVIIGADGINSFIYDASDSQVITTSVAIHGSIDTHGGYGGNGLNGVGYTGYASGGWGGSGGTVALTGIGAITVSGSIMTYGGVGGNGSNASSTGSSGGDGGEGAWGGSVSVYGSSVSTGAIFAYGGAGGNGGNSNGVSGNGGRGGTGGSGGYVNVNAASGGVTTGSIDAHGGDGGSGGSGASGYSGGDGGDGGVGGYVDITGTSIDTTNNGSDIGSIATYGGNGGPSGGGSAGGSGGAGGAARLSASGAVEGGAIYTFGGTGGSGAENGIAGSGGSWEIDADTITLAASDFGFFANGTVNAISAFEFDPINTSSLTLDHTAFDVLGSSVPIYRIGNSTTNADLVLTGTIDLTSTVTNSLSLKTTGAVTGSNASMILPGALSVNAGGNVVLTGPGNQIDGRIDIATTPSSYINLNNATPLTTLGNISGAWFYGYGAGDVNVLGTVTGPGGIHIEAGASGIWTPSGLGGNLTLALGSALNAGSQFIELAAHNGSGPSNGDITFTGATMTMSAGSQGDYLSADGNVGMGQITASGAPVVITAGGTILGAGTNITAGNATLTSIGGSAPGSIAIGAGVNATGMLTAAVNGASGDIQLDIGNTVPSAFALTPAANGRWLVYASSPAVTSPATLAFDFKQYGYSYTAGTLYSGLGTGNGLIYAASAAITPVLSPITKTYDGTTTANVTSALNFTTLQGDTLTLAAGEAANYNSKDVLTANSVTANFSIAGVSSSSGKPVYGYSLPSTAVGAGTITVRPLSTWIGGTSGNWSVASNWDAIPDLSNVLAVTIPSGTTVTYDTAAGTTNLASLTAGGISIAGGTLNISNSMTVSSSFSQTGGTLGAFGGGSSASITQATGSLTLPAITVANLNLNAPTGAITQSGPLAALTLITQSQGATTLNNPSNQVAGRVDMTAGGPLSLWTSGNLTLGAINAGANPVQIKAGGAILQAPGTESSTNIVASSADLSSIFGGASGNLAISSNTQVTGALTATVGTAADFGGIRIKNTGAEPANVTLTDNALAGASVSFLNTGDITSTAGITLKTLTGGDLALLSNGNLTWDGGSLATPTGSVQISADGTLAITGALSSPVDLALSSTSSINVSGSVVTAGAGTASFTAPGVALNGTVNSADDVGIIATTINLGAGSSTGAAHDVIFAASDITATNATVSAGHDISAAVTGDMHLNGSGFTAGNDIYVNMLGATSTLYLNDAAGPPRSFLWAQAPSTIHLEYAAEASGGLVVDGTAVDPLKFVSTSGGSGLFYGAAKLPATPGAGLDVVYGVATPGAPNTVAPTLFDAVIAAISASTTTTTIVGPAGTLPPSTFGGGLGLAGSGGTPGSDQTIGGGEGGFGGSGKEDEDKNKTDQATGLKKGADKSITRKLSTCS